MQPTDITEASPYLVLILTKTLIDRKQFPRYRNESFDDAFHIVLKFTISKATNKRSVSASYSAWYDLKHALEGACTIKLKQAVMDEIALMGLDSIT